jgi:hypothetical protein
MQPATIRMAQYPLGEVAAALEAAHTETNAALNVRLARDHAQAAYFVAEDLDKIVMRWRGPQAGLEFVLRFVTAFPNLYEELPPAPR